MGFLEQMIMLLNLKLLGVYQQGAGNGKTYGIWKSITENIDRKTYIIVTKQHSAKM